jgi:hypothetical protein
MTDALHILSLLTRAVPLFPAASIKATCEALLRVLTLGDAHAAELCMQVCKGN